MPQLQNVVLKDRATPTPVDHTYVPRDINSAGVATVVESASVPIGQASLSISLRKTGGKYKGRLFLIDPVVQTIEVDGVSLPKVIRNGRVNVEVIFDETSTKQERNNTIGKVASALGVDKPLVHDTFVELQGIY